MTKTLVKAVAVLAALCLLLLGGPSAVAGGKKADRVGAISAETMKIRIDAAKGRDKWRSVTPKSRVFVRTKAGERVRTDLNALARGAVVKATKIRSGKVKAITLAAKGATGATDCSFDSSEDDGDSVEDGDSFDCSHDYDDGTLDTDSDCSYDSSADGPSNDWSMDVSWDCSYSETDDTDEDEGGLDWDCSFSASAGGSSDVDGGDADADLDFDCSWSGADSDSALWDCRFIPGVLGFECTSAQLDQTFGYTIDTADMAIEGGMDFQTDLVDDDSGDDDGVRCSGSAADGYDCSVDGESGNGDCGADWDFDRSRGSREGDVSGSLSYSCSWDS